MAAALFRKPAFIYLHQGFEASERLQGFLELIRPAFPDASFQAISSEEILRRVDALVKHVRSLVLRHLPLRVPRKRLFLNELFRRRHSPYRVRDEPPPVRFLDGHFDSTVDPSRAAEVPALLERANDQPNYEHRLVMLWFAIHALMGVPYTERRWSQYVELWEAVLGSWNSAGAWYGLHGHAAMAGIAALGSLSAARATVASPTDARHGIPHGPLASAYYSIAKQAANRAIYDIALEHVDMALMLKPPDETNLRAIRGSILMRLGDRPGAITEYAAVAEARRDHRAGVFGEALSELGYALVMSGRRNEGLAAMERGVELLLRDPRPGFDIRAIRKLAVGYALCAEPVHAFHYAVMAYDRAEQTDARDQITKTERLAKSLDRLLSRATSARR